MRGLPSRYVPRRVFLDSNALQALQEHGGTIFEGEPFQRAGRSGADEHDAEALRWIMVFAERGAFEFALSENSLREVAASGDHVYLRWAYDVLDHWEACLASSDAPFAGASASAVRALDDGLCGYLSAADRHLVRDAVLLECDTFLTIERRLTRNARHMSKVLGIEAVRPPELWEVLRPHVRGL